MKDKKMDCVFDWCIQLSSLFPDIVESIYESDLFPGVLSSIIATGITLSCVYIRNRLQDRKKFSKAKGKYHGDESKGVVASVEYKGGNRLRIELKHEDPEKGTRKWKGLITMDNEQYGTLGAQYEDDPEEFDFKRCIISDDGKKICLISENPQSGYGKEILTRNE